MSTTEGRKPNLAANDISPLGSTETADSREGFYLRLIGLSAVRHSFLDHIIRLLISKLAAMKSATGEIVMKHQSTRQLLGALERITKDKFPTASPLQQSLRDFVKDVNNTNKCRNAVLHGLWAFDHLGRGQRVNQMQKTLPIDLEQLPGKELDELKQLNRDLDRLSEDALNILHRLEEL